jgi:hypothetical protein
LAVPLVVGGLLPTVVARTPLLAWGIRTAARWDGGVTVRRASLGWFSPVVLEGVELRDPQDQPFLELAGLASQKTLWQILGNFPAAGSFRLDKPKLTLLVRREGSNLEDLLAKYQTAEAAPRRVAFALQIVDGSITVVDVPSEQSWEIQKIEVTLDSSPGMVLPERLELAASVADAKQPGSLRMRFDQQPREAPSKAASPAVLDPGRTCGQLHLEAEAIPAAMLQQLAGRLVPELRLSGTLGSKLDLQWAGTDQVGADAELSVGSLAVGSRQLGKDTVRLDRGRVACRAALQGGQVDIRQATLDCDFLKISAIGSLDRLAASLSFNLKPLGDALGRSVGRGGLDLAGDGWGTFHWGRSADQGFQAEGEIQVRNLRVASPWGNLSEPLAGLTLTGGWDPKAQRGHVDAATLSGEALAAEAKKIVLARAAGGPWELCGGRLVVGPDVRIELQPAARAAGEAGPQPLKTSSSPQVEPTPAIGQAALKFIAPVLAETAGAQGTFSIELDDYRIPLAQPAKGEIAGRLLVQSLQVTPGPLVRELAQLLTQLEPVRLKPQSVIPFRMVGGRIYHEGIELRFSDLTIRTSGSVGLDQSLALMAQMPVPPKWVANMPVAASLGNLLLRIPITGTLRQPRLDRDELAKAGRQLLGQAARDLLKAEVGRQLDQLLTPPR